MPKLIDANELLEELQWLEVDAPVFHDVSETICSQPTVDAEPVRHGHWENYLTKGLRWKCTECGSRFETPYHYCPHCGAKMDEVEDGETN